MSAPAEPADQTAVNRHPAADVPDPLFADPEKERRFRQRFAAIRIGLADPARDEPQRAVYLSNATGIFELYTWDIESDTRVQATARAEGTTGGTLDADGGALWWFDDTDGDELGSWRKQPFGTGPGAAVTALPDVAPGYPAGLELGRSVTLAGFSDDDGTRIHLLPGEGRPTVVYRHETDASVAALSRDETIWVLSHSEHGDSRYPVLRAISVADQTVLGELDDTPGKGLSGYEFSPVEGDQRLLVGHERHGREELLIWDVATGEVTELALDLPGDLSGAFYPKGDAVLVLQTFAGRNQMFRHDLATGTTTPVPAAVGTVLGAVVRPNGDIWYRWSSAAVAAQLRSVSADGTDRTLLLPPGEPPGPSQPAHDLVTAGPAGEIHTLIGYPDDRKPESPAPAVFSVHGGPAAADEDVYDAERAGWLDAGFVVVQVNYRGSTGYGSTWRDALTERIGHIELADIAAVYDDLVAAGTIDPARTVIAGGSWGGFLALLALGTQPERWAAGVAAAPVADYLAAYDDEMEPLRAYDRALFGGSPTDKPDAYRDSSPLTWVESVRVPLLVLAGANDPRTPLRQIENYLQALADGGHDYRVYSYDAGHGSVVVEERIRQAACEIAFARAAVGL